MTNKYVVKFTKNGYAKYTSHLDLLRLFKRAFKKSRITLKYSQGFNPHPKISFAQPLSLGYSSKCELLEFETEQTYTTEELLYKLKDEMPQGIEIVGCETLDKDLKALAAIAEQAEYKIYIPTILQEEELQEGLKRYLQQDEIVALKRMKKTKKKEPVEIKKMIRSLEVSKLGEFAVLVANLDCGSISNCSPELVIPGFCEKAGISVARYEIEVVRTNLIFVNNLHF